MAKKRTLNEYRQVKDSVYETTKVKLVEDYYKKVNFDPQYIVDLIKQHPNDMSLGKSIREYYLSLKNNS